MFKLQTREANKFLENNRSISVVKKIIARQLIVFS